MGLTKAAWTGQLNFGPITIGVKLYQARENHTPGLHMVHAADGGRVRYQKVCERCETVLTQDQIGRGVERPDGSMAVLNEVDLDRAMPSSRSADVVTFTYPGNIPTDLFDQLYYVDAHNGASSRAARKIPNRAYAIFRDALFRTGTAAIVRIAIRQREQLAAVWPVGDHLVLRTLYWADELRAPEFPDAKLPVTVDDQEVAMAAHLIDTMTSDFEPRDHADHYSDKLRELITAAQESVPAADESTSDLIAALAQAVKAKTG